jgi:soluble lytic murein transglycosylase-like protein
MNLLIILALLSALNSGSTLTFVPALSHEIIFAYELKYGIPSDDLYTTLKCESGLNPKAVNLHDAHGGSYGIAQINAAHTELTRAQMFDPIFSINWSAQQFAAGHQYIWSCYKGGEDV